MAQPIARCADGVSLNASGHRFWYSDAYQKDTKPLRDGTGLYDVALFTADKA